MEGPPLRVVAEELQKFEGALVIQTSGNSKIDKRLINNQKITKIFVVGKNLFLQFGKFTLRIHFLMFGSYRINEERLGVSPRLSLVSSNGVLNFYNTAIRLLSIEEATALYDEEVDILSEKWNINKVTQLASQSPNSLICDVLLDQNVFAGVGNIIKNEALFMSKIHPLSITGKIPKQQLVSLAKDARQFSILFYETVKKDQSLRSRLLVYGKRNCPLCGKKNKIQKTGKLRRISYFCESTQQLFI